MQRKLRLALVTGLALLCALVLVSPAGALEQKLTMPGLGFGFSTAIDGDTLVVGNPFDSSGAGAVYVYRRSGDTWAVVARLTASDGSAGDALGSSVAINGDTIVAGASGDGIDHNATDQGSVYTFARDGGPLRTETAKLTASDGAVRASLGASVAIDGNTIVAGAPGKTVGTNANQGAVYTFARAGAPDRTQTAKLTVSGGAERDQLGGSVAIDGDTIVAGASDATVGANLHQGAVYTFASSGGPARTQTATLTVLGGVEAEFLGASVDIAGDTIVAGAPTGQGTGAVYTFARSGGLARAQTAKLTASDAGPADLLGNSVAIEGDTIVAAAPNADVGANVGEGALYTFDRGGAVARTQTAKLTDASGAAGEEFGAAVAIAGDTIVASSVGQAAVAVFFAATPPPSPSPPPPLAPPAPPPPPSSPPPPAAPTKLVLSGLEISPTRFRSAPSALNVSKTRAGATIRFTLSEAANVKLSFAQARPGRIASGKCRQPNRSSRAKPRCTRYVTVGSFTVHGQRGPNAVRFAGTLPRTRRLTPGPYKLTATPTDSAHNPGPPRSTNLTITPN